MTKLQQYEVMKRELNERQWRLFLATEAKQIPYGGISKIVHTSGTSWKTIKRGLVELDNPQRLPKGKIRMSGGGRKKLVEKDTRIVHDLEEIIDTIGNPMSFVKYTTKSCAHLVEQLHNNQAERDLRDVVMIRNISRETKSLAGDRSIERHMLIIQTAKKQGLDVFQTLHGLLTNSLPLSVLTANI